MPLVLPILLLALCLLPTGCLGISSLPPAPPASPALVTQPAPPVGPVTATQPPATLPPAPATQPAPASAVPILPPPTSAPLPPSATPLPTQMASVTAVPGPSPLPVTAALVSRLEDVILAGDGWGAQNRALLSLGPVSSLAYREGRVAYVANGTILVADLRGGEPQRVADCPPAFLLGPDLVWTGNGQALLTIADQQDSTAKQTGRRIDIGVVMLPNGPWRPGLALADRSGVTILQAGQAGGQVLLVAWGAEPAFKEVLRYDLANGRLLASLPMAGEGELAPSPDGKLALTTLLDRAKGINASLIYDLGATPPAVRYRQEHPSGSHAIGHVWSPDGRRVAYLLREGKSFADSPGRGLGIWVWDLEKGSAVKVAEASDPSGGPVVWTPDGRYLIYRHIDAAGAGAYYAVSPEEGKPRLLSLEASSSILGWLTKG